MNEHQRRQEAVSRYLAGEKVISIACLMNKSRKWVHTWINRYKSSSTNETWYRDESKAPKQVKRSLSSDIEQQIISIRNDLTNEKMGQIGAISIQYECARRGIVPPPAIWTINRIISRHGLVKENVVHQKPKQYPDLFLHTHQMDLVGPRYLKGDGKFFSVNIIDVTTRSCFVKAVRTKSSDGIVEAIASFWRSHGMPDALQMDNELAFRGSNRYPRSFGSVIRFALSQGVAVVFIPVGEPWRNGIIEKFNHTYQKKFLQVHTFQNLEDVSQREQSFIDFHNNYHRYSIQAHKTPNEMKALSLPPILYNDVINIKEKIPLTQGSIYFIRYIRSDLQLFMPNETFTVLKELKYSYVVAEINVVNRSLIIRQDGSIKQIIPYAMSVEW